MIEAVVYVVIFVLAIHMFKVGYDAAKPKERRRDD